MTFFFSKGGSRRGKYCVGVHRKLSLLFGSRDEFKGLSHRASLQSSLSPYVFLFWMTIFFCLERILIRKRKIKCFCFMHHLTLWSFFETMCLTILLQRCWILRKRTGRHCSWLWFVFVLTLPAKEPAILPSRRTVCDYISYLLSLDLRRQKVRRLKINFQGYKRGISCAKRYFEVWESYGAKA